MWKIINHIQCLLYLFKMKEILTKSEDLNKICKELVRLRDHSSGG